MVITEQRYQPGLPWQRMASGDCPECGRPPAAHSGDPRFWVRPGQPCDLLPRGVSSRIDQYRRDHPQTS